MQYLEAIVREWDILVDAKILFLSIFLCGAFISYGLAKWRYIKQIQLQKTQADFQKDRAESLKDENENLRKSLPGDTLKAKGFIELRSIRSQALQPIEGVKLIEKWGIKASVLLYIVKNNLINAYAPDLPDIVNSTDNDFERSIGFYSENNEIDEDTVIRFRFMPRDIARFEMIAEKYKTNT